MFVCMAAWSAPGLPWDRETTGADEPGGKWAAGPWFPQTNGVQAMPRTTRAKRPEMIYKSFLKQRYGLTDRLIEELGDPDELVVNLHYKSGPPASLYRVDRVKRFVADHSDEIKQARRSGQPRRKSEATAVDW